MAERTDILLDENYDIIDLGDEWAEGESDQQHVELLLLIQKGEIKEFPHMGFGMESWLKQRYDKEAAYRELNVTLENDGYKQFEIELGESLKHLNITV